MGSNFTGEAESKACFHFIFMSQILCDKRSDNANRTEEALAWKVSWRLRAQQQLLLVSE